MGNESSTQSGGSSSSNTQRRGTSESPANGFGSFVNNSSVSSAQASQAGAYKMPGQPRNQRFYVTIPRGVRSGQHFAVLVNGQQMMVGRIKCSFISLVYSKLSISNFNLP